MRLGTAGVPGNDRTHFNAPSDIVVAPNGDVFVADGHGVATNNRVVKFGSDGRYIKEWGGTGTGAGPVPHDARDRDRRARPRVRRRPRQQPHPAVRPGRHAPRDAGRSSAGRAASSSITWTASSSRTPSPTTSRTPAGTWACASATRRRAPCTSSSSIRGATRASGRATAPSSPSSTCDGNIYGGEPRPRRLQKYVRVRP